jgi:hypothetical protein
MLNEKIQEVIRLRQQLRVEESLAEFLKQPKAHLSRSDATTEDAYYRVVLTIDGARVAGAESRSSYVDALANALWAYDLERGAQLAEQSIQPS